MKVLAIAHLTLTELWRQRTQWGFFLVGALLALPALIPLEGVRINGAQPLAEAFASGLLGFAQFMALFLAIAGTSSLVAGDQDRGTILLLASKPLHRHTLLLGKLVGGGLYMTLAWLAWGLIAGSAMAFRFGGEHFVPVLLAFIASAGASWLVVAFTLFWSCWLPANATVGLAVLGYVLFTAAPQVAEGAEAMGKTQLAAFLTWMGRALPVNPLSEQAKALLEGSAPALEGWWPLGLVVVWWLAAAALYARRDLGGTP